MSDTDIFLLDEADRLNKYFPVMPIPKPGVKIGNKTYNGKEAIIKDWDEISEPATAGQLETWFNGKHQNNIAIILGTHGFMIDTDGERCGTLFWKQVVPTLSDGLREAIRKTARTRTGGRRGAHHIWYQAR